MNIQELIDSHIFADRVIKSIDYACRNHKRIMLYGPRGHGKSYFSKEVVLNHFDEKDVFKIQAGAGSTLEVLTGYLDFAKYQREGIKENRMENSMLSYKVVIIEELFDWYAQLLLFFKDVVMAGELCLNGNVCFKSRNLVIIACTNLDPYAWVHMGRPEEVESRLAFIDRFLFKVRVDWPDYGKMSWTKMVEKKYEKENQIRLQPMTSLMAMCHLQGVFVSPRTAEEYFNVFLGDGIEPLEYTDIPQSLLEILSESQEDFNKDVDILIRVSELRERIEELLESFNPIDNTIEELEILEKEPAALDLELSSMVVGHLAANEVGKARTRLLMYINMIDSARDDLNPIEEDDTY